MKRLLLTLPLLALTACGHLDSPADRYLVALQTGNAAMEFTKGYLAECLKQEPSDPCYGHRDGIRDGLAVLTKAKAEASKVFETGDSPYYDLSLTVLENAIANLNRSTGRE
ncbi:MAG: hypothetical protein K2X87_25495 [Gemmataceae bacterium]|nr:hypothetical protein [Gemmataceae bacterium]